MSDEEIKTSEVLDEIEQLSEHKFVSAPDCWKTQQWLDMIAKIKEKYNWTCARCGTKFPSDTKLLRGHHLVYLYKRQVWEYPDDLVVPLCVDCHDAVHKNKWKPPAYSNEIEAREYAIAHPIKINAPIGDDSTNDELEDAYEEFKISSMAYYGMDNTEKKKGYMRSSKRNVYKKVTFYLEKEIVKMLDEIKKTKHFNWNMPIRAAAKLLTPVKKHIIEECETEEDIDTVLRRYYMLVG